jgi:glutamate formiminotransferase/formiminotetrahydrofolate cyclodeaminase
MGDVGTSVEGSPLLEGTLRGFLDALTSPEPVPGGGSTAALAGALAAALVGMVAGLTAGSPKYAEVAEAMKVLLGRSEALREDLQDLVEEDAAAYARVAVAFKMPKESAAEREARQAVLQKALVGATETPLRVQRSALAVAELAGEAAEKGNRNAVSDAGVAALLAEAACRAAALNVGINAPYLADQVVAEAYRAESFELSKSTGEATARALEFTRSAMS